jgi:hypothetical protein
MLVLQGQFEAKTGDGPGLEAAVQFQIFDRFGYRPLSGVDRLIVLDEWDQHLPAPLRIAIGGFHE